MGNQAVLARYVLLVRVRKLVLIMNSLAVEKKFPGDREKLARMSLIEGTPPPRTYTLVTLTNNSLCRGLPAKRSHGQSRCHRQS